MTTETDWAFKYAEERKRSIKTARRLAAMLYESCAFSNRTMDLLDSLLSPSSEFTEAFPIMMDLVRWRQDVEALFRLNALDPPWDQSPEDHQGMIDFYSHPDTKAPEPYKAATDAFLEKSARESSHEWHDHCEAHDWNCVCKARTTVTRDFIDSVLPLVSKEVREQLEKALTRPA